jgi:hypothetical protein
MRDAIDGNKKFLILKKPRSYLAGRITLIQSPVNRD